MDYIDVVDSLIQLAVLSYLPPSKHSPMSILKFYIQSWRHSTILVDLFWNKSFLSKEKLFGKHFHNLTVHAAEENRVFQTSLTHAEREEYEFSMLKVRLLWHLDFYNLFFFK